MNELKANAVEQWAFERRDEPLDIASGTRRPN
jgi:hypothetical protein